MKQKQQATLKNRLHSRIPSLSLDKDDMRKLCDILEERSNAAADIEVQSFEKGNLTDIGYNDAIDTLRESFLLRVTINGVNGEELYGSIEDVFSSVNFPDNVKSLYVNNEHILKAVHNYHQHNSFELFLDFSKPAIFDFSLLPHQGTPNQSNYVVQGYDATWVNGVFSEIKNFIKKHGSTLSIVHRHSIYDVLLWVIGFPLAFWYCFKASPYIDQSNFSSFVTSAIYLYTFMASLFIFRVLFHYLRWVCPLVEFNSKGSNIIAHRAILTVLLLAVLGNFITEIIKIPFSN